MQWVAALGERRQPTTDSGKQGVGTLRRSAQPQGCAAGPPCVAGMPQSPCTVTPLMATRPERHTRSASYGGSAGGRQGGRRLLFRQCTGRGRVLDCAACAWHGAEQSRAAAAAGLTGQGDPADGHIGGVEHAHQPRAAGRRAGRAARCVMPRHRHAASSALHRCCTKGSAASWLAPSPALLGVVARGVPPVAHRLAPRLPAAIVRRVAVCACLLPGGRRGQDPLAALAVEGAAAGEGAAGALLKAQQVPVLLAPRVVGALRFGADEAQGSGRVRAPGGARSVASRLRGANPGAGTRHWRRRVRCPPSRSAGPPAGPPHTPGHRPAG